MLLIYLRKVKELQFLNKDFTITCFTLTGISKIKKMENPIFGW